MFAVFVGALLCWLAVGHSSPPSCENLLQPLGSPDFQHVVGTWPLVAGSLGNASHMDILEKRDSVSIVFADASNSSAVPMTLTINVNNTCRYEHTHVKVEGNDFFIEGRAITGAFLKTSCHDCMLIDFDDATKAHRRLFLFSKKREVDPQEKEEFTARAACLNMTSPVWKDPAAMLCQEH